MKGEGDRLRAPLLPWWVGLLGVLALLLAGAWLLWPVLRAVAILAVDAVLLAGLGLVLYFCLRRRRGRKESAVREEAEPIGPELPPPREEQEELPEPEEEPAPEPVPERDRAAEIEAKLQAIKRRLGKM